MPSPQTILPLRVYQLQYRNDSISRSLKN
jgi:hypothetical protein